MIDTDFQWFLPSWYGDIRLRVLDEHHTRLEVTKLSQSELAALHALKKRSLQGGLLRRKWATEKAWESMPNEAFAMGRQEVHHVNLKAPIGKIEAFLTQQLRGRSSTVSVTITDQGNLYEIKSRDPESDTNVLPFRRPAELPEAKEKPKAATTVRKPTIGCPAPNFEPALIRATEVLKAFLTPEQVEDYERHQKFVTVGGASGRRYLLTSRHASSSADAHARTVRDIDRGIDLCVHDWGIPAPEELLTMHLMLSLPKYEGYVNGLGDDGSHGVIERRGILSEPPRHFYYDRNGCLTPVDEIQSAITTCSSNGNN